MSYRRPNILRYCTDQQRWDTIQALGNPHIRTPRLDALCATGTAFERAYAQSPICPPSPGHDAGIERQTDRDPR